LADVCLLDVIEGWPQGLAMDIRHSAPVQGISVSVVGTNDYADAADSDIVVITAGLPRGPGMSRMDLLGKNAEIVGSVAGQVRDSSPDAVVIVVTNPLDEMTFLAAERTGFPRSRVMGMAGILDSARLAANIAEELSVSPLEVNAMTLGSHGEQMVPLPRQATVGGRPLTELADAATLDRLFVRTRNGGAEIVGLLKKGSAFYAPSAATVQMCRAVLNESDEVLPVCAWVSGQYGIDPVYLGVPAKLGRTGVREIVELDLSPEELAQLTEAADAIRGRCADLAKVGAPGS
ncbi:MAG TPA: malate dehydrogenase, partial [Candidatus Thermoplasmatota archaeon]|nr:malate dehydrogenase [Candidatus Thermoplasmatota archaeon]